MSQVKTEMVALIPPDEARDLVMKAAAMGCNTPDLLGMLILEAAYGSLHPEVIAFHKRAKQGQVGTQE